LVSAENSFAKALFLCHVIIFVVREVRMSMDRTDQIMAMSRDEIVQLLAATGYIFSLPEATAGKYLFGRTKNERAACLMWPSEKSLS
jgi:hypothetical protein